MGEWREGGAGAKRACWRGGAQKHIQQEQCGKYRTWWFICPISVHKRTPRDNCMQIWWTRGVWTYFCTGLTVSGAWPRSGTTPAQAWVENLKCTFNGSFRTALVYDSRDQGWHQASEVCESQSSWTTEPECEPRSLWCQSLCLKSNVSVRGGGEFSMKQGQIKQCHI